MATFYDLLKDILLLVAGFVIQFYISYLNLSQLQQVMEWVTYFLIAAIAVFIGRLLGRAFKEEDNPWKEFVIAAGAVLVLVVFVNLGFQYVNEGSFEAGEERSEPSAEVEEVVLVEPTMAPAEEAIVVPTAVLSAEPEPVLEPTTAVVVEEEPPVLEPTPALVEQAEVVLFADDFSTGLPEWEHSSLSWNLDTATHMFCAQPTEGTSVAILGQGMGWSNYDLVVRLFVFNWPWQGADGVFLRRYVQANMLSAQHYFFNEQGLSELYQYTDTISQLVDQEPVVRPLATAPMAHTIRLETREEETAVYVNDEKALATTKPVGMGQHGWIEIGVGAGAKVCLDEVQVVAYNP